MITGTILVLATLAPSSPCDASLDREVETMGVRYRGTVARHAHVLATVGWACMAGGPIVSGPGSRR